MQTREFHGFWVKQSAVLGQKFANVKNFYYLCSRKHKENNQTGKKMSGRFLIAGPMGTHVGSLNENEYSRRLPGRPPGITAVCKKPRYTRSQKKKMAQRASVLRFVNVSKMAQIIWHDPEKKSEWAVRHEAALKEGKRHNMYVPVRLWDYIRHTLNEDAKANKNAAQNT